MSQKLKLDFINFGSVPNPPVNHLVIGVDIADGKIKYKTSSGSLFELGKFNGDMGMTSLTTGVSLPITSTQYGGKPTHLNNKLYCGTGHEGVLKVVDISDPTVPYVCETVSAHVWNNATDGKILACIGFYGVNLYDITTPTLTYLSYRDVRGWGVAINKNLLSVSGYYGNLCFYDISDPINPVLLLNDYGRVGNPNLTDIEDGLCVQQGTTGFAIYDVSPCYGISPTAPILKCTIVPPSWAQLSAGGPAKIFKKHLFVGDYYRLWIYDLADPAVPVLKKMLSSADTAGHGWPADFNTIFVTDRYLYTSSPTNAWINIWDITDLSNPVLKTSHSTSGIRPCGMEIVGKHIWCGTRYGQGLRQYIINESLLAPSINTGNIRVSFIASEEIDTKKLRAKQSIFTEYLETDRFKSPEYILMKKAMAGDITIIVNPQTINTPTTSSAWTRDVTVTIETASGDIHTWLNETFTNVLEISDTSIAGTASIVSTDLTFVNGVATIVISGDANNWLPGETDTLSVGSGEEIVILGYQLLNGIITVDSIETFIA